MMREERAYTFVELVVAMGVAAVWLASLFGILVFMGRYEAGSRLSVTAVLCAQERMEELRYDVERGDLLAGEGQESLEVGPYKGMQRSWDVVSSPLQSGLKEIEVECVYSWEGETKKERLLSLADIGE